MATHTYTQRGSNNEHKKELALINNKVNENEIKMSNPLLPPPQAQSINNSFKIK